jgi:DNA-binding NarL/FixJ family response regulator
LRSIALRERAVFQLIGCSKTIQKIGDELNLSPKTIEVDRSNIRAKLKITAQ